jgi:hypothetical protein
MLFQMEKATILKVREHFAGYRVESVEDDNLGWDLKARPKGAGTALRLEVKGLFGSELKVGLTPREYRALQKHVDGSMPQYRLCVVAGALSASPSWLYSGSIRLGGAGLMAGPARS